jgi:tetratricopeptide (TPR) repeat protein
VRGFRFAVAPELAPGLLAVGLFIAWAAAGGGFDPSAQYPGSLFLAGLLAVILITMRSRLPRLPTATIAALALLGAFAAWSFLSIIWAGDKGIAWDGANLALAYLTAFTLFAVPRWSATSAAIVFGTFATGLAVVGAIVVLDAAGSRDPLLFFVDGRLADPTGYYNATAALFLGAFFPAIFIASRREVPWPARALLLAVAGLLIQLAILPQSRGSAIAFPIALVIYLAVAPNRGRTVLAMLPVAAVTAIITPTLLDVYEAAKAGDPVTAVDDARNAMVLAFVVVLAIGVVIALVDRRVEVSSSSERVLGRTVNVGLVACAIAGIAVAISVIGNPVSWAEDRWEDFKSGSQPGFEASRFTGALGSARYDAWRVSLDEFADSPLNGIGSENFAAAYLLERRSDEELLYPHSLPLGILSQTGLIGTLLFGGFFVFAVGGVVRTRWGDASPLARGVAAATLAALAYWLVHASADWFWEFPALTAPILAWLAMAGAVERPDREPRRQRETEDAQPPLGRPAAVAGVVLGGAIALFAAASYLLPWIASRDVDQASASWGADPAGAYERLDDASTLNFVSDRADLIEGAIATRLGDLGRARKAFADAHERNPDGWYALFELGAIEAVEGHPGPALEYLREARTLNPDEPLIPRVARGARGHPVALEDIDAAFLGRVCDRIGRTDDTAFCR